ncbi:Type I restriction endonuclease subunit M [Cupriavidus respiraculi]|uniref:Type I restriction endonuclease subunit M n=2 Tax=Cupriavidus respiraculi TaxID=195930 RepID=A0ABN7ZEL8_9BURK|nr:hypothetical protein [Cupriavidus respiraculi]CAG9184114.1 hypothetical protein LMG21510_05028 [Cupriavidus respiraculi]
MQDDRISHLLRRPARFGLGLLCITTGAWQALNAGGEDPLVYLARHVTGDWGDLCEEDRRANESAVSKGGRLHSAYRIGDGPRLWVITEADRSITTLLLPTEY